MERDGIVHMLREVCPNRINTTFGHALCPFEEMLRLQKERDQAEGAEEMLNFYWNMDTETDCPQFLKDRSMVYSYQYTRVSAAL